MKKRNKEEIQADMNALAELLNSCGFRAFIDDDGETLKFGIRFREKVIFGIPQDYEQ